MLQQMLKEVGAKTQARVLTDEVSQTETWATVASLKTEGNCEGLSHR